MSNRMAGRPMQTIVKRYRATYDDAGCWVTRHLLRAEKALGKSLPVGAVVHHADGTKNADAQLVICQDSAYHNLLHRRMRIVKAGGNPDTEKVCCDCAVPQTLEAFHKDSNSGDGRKYFCKRCAPARKRAAQRGVQ